MESRQIQVATGETKPSSMIIQKLIQHCVNSTAIGRQLGTQLRSNRLSTSFSAILLPTYPAVAKHQTSCFQEQDSGASFSVSVWQAITVLVTRYPGTSCWPPTSFSMPQPPQTAILSTLSFQHSPTTSLQLPNFELSPFPTSIQPPQSTPSAPKASKSAR